MVVKFINKEPRLVGSRHCVAGDTADLPDGHALRLVRAKIAERVVKTADTDGKPETATIKTELETPEGRRAAKGSKA